MSTEIIEGKIKERITKVEEWKEAAMDGYLKNIGTSEIEWQSAALNLSYGMELTFLKELLALLKQ